MDFVSKGWVWWLKRSVWASGDICTTLPSRYGRRASTISALLEAVAVFVDHYIFKLNWTGTPCELVTDNHKYKISQCGTERAQLHDCCHAIQLVFENRDTAMRTTSQLVL